MDITQYTSYDEIRLLLGVSSMELTDESLSLPLVGYWLTTALNAVYPGLPALYEGWVQLNPPTPEEDAAIAAVCVFATYVLAREVRSTSSGALLKSITDGRAKAERFGPGKDDWSWFLENFNRAREALIAALVALDLMDEPAPLAPRVFFGAADLGVDPVVGEQQ